jgi:hypothetical protein
MGNSLKRKDGFEGEKLINIPQKVLKEYIKRYPALFNIYITQIGYFPKASYHYKERRRGCDDNILIYCIKGKGYYVIDKKKFEITPNQFFIIPKTEVYMRYWADEEDPWTIYWVHFTGDDIENFNRSLNIGEFKGPVHIPFTLKRLIYGTIFIKILKWVTVLKTCVMPVFACIAWWQPSYFRISMLPTTSSAR